MTEGGEDVISRLPDQLLVEIFVLIPVREWGTLSSVCKDWANIFRGECLWHTVISRTWPIASSGKRWPGPIPRGSGRRRYTALYVSENFIPSDVGVEELLGHVYLYLKEQLEYPKIPFPSSIIHGTIIDQFLACGKTKEKAFHLAKKIWIAVLDNLEENNHTFSLLKHIALERDLFLPHPYSRSYEVLWKVFDKLLTDYRDCFTHADYCNVVSIAKSKFNPVPSTWLGY